jgi:hypothetical protein
MGVDRDGNVIVHGDVATSATSDPTAATVTLTPNLATIVRSTPLNANSAEQDNCDGRGIPAGGCLSPDPPCRLGW